MYLLFSGIHHKKTECDSKEMTKKVKDILDNAKSYLYPSNVVVTQKVVPYKQQKYFKANGGWGDPRDHTLCMNMSIVST